MTYVVTVHKDVWRNIEHLGQLSVADESDPSGHRHIELRDFTVDLATSGDEVTATLTEKSGE